MRVNDDELRALAKQRLKKQAGFKQYLLVWAAVSIIVVIVWALTTPGGYFWPGWVIFGMGIGALFSGIDAYSRNPKVITDEQIDGEVARLKGDTPNK